jgi:hypothetical protein
MLTFGFFFFSFNLDPLTIVVVVKLGLIWWGLKDGADSDASTAKGDFFFVKLYLCSAFYDNSCTLI